MVDTLKNLTLTVVQRTLSSYQKREVQQDTPRAESESGKYYVE